MSTHVIHQLIGSLWVLTLWSSSVVAQTTYQISGHVTDATTGVGIPFVSVAIKGTTAGTTSDAEGRFKISTSHISDSLLVSSLGYQTRAYRLLAINSQTVDVTLTPAAKGLQEVKVYAKGGDPAYRIIREAIRRRDQFNTSQLPAFQYESYSKVEAYVNNFTEAGRRGRGPGFLGRQLAKLPAITDESGKPAVPVYVSETASEYYYRSNPAKVKERILKSRASGVGITDGGVSAQLTGASFQQYNFYENYVSILRKDLPSPLGQFWQTAYRFHLMDTVSLDGMVCFKIDFEPQRVTDLAFNGTVWIDTTQYGLSKIDAQIDKRANINFVDEIRLEQDWEEITDSTNNRPVRMPVLTQLLIDTDEPTERAPGLLIRMYLAAQHIKLAQPYEPSFYEPALELAETYRETSPAYWQQARPQNLSSQELRAFEVVDSVRNVPAMKTIGEVVKLTTVGYFPLKSLPVDVGPLLYSYAYNDTEGNRFRLGLRTNTNFSRRWVLSGYTAYGTRDQRGKYNVGIDYIANKKPWTVIGLQHSYDLEQLGITDETIGTNVLFIAYSRFGTLRRPYLQQNTYGYVRRELGSGFTQTLGLRSRTFEPQFAFAYQKPNDADQGLYTSYRTTEVAFETRFAPGELMVQNDNERYGVGSSNQLVMLFRYNMGLQALGGDLTYHRFSLSLKHSFRLGVLGRTAYQLNLGYMPSTVPYPLLFIPLGNESWFRLSNAYNLMNYFEFATDRYAGLMVEHNFEGLFFNRLPAIRRLKWRFLATGKVLVGSVSSANQHLTPATDQQGQPLLGFRPLGQTPYVEVGYGIDNIFKVFRVDAIHRLTYRTNPDVSLFSIKVSAWINL
ncbi:DUF5686 family protein [Spirosoma soli]|uniref:DUF5686 family protein n=1 Tax=Spirosoma soli TaxID=1770529 RepID=A0ABW5M8C6_9BACT